MMNGMFTEPFMVHAWIAGTVIAIISAVIGFFVVIRGSTFAAHALPQAGFAGGAGAVLLNINPVFGLSAFALGGALFIGTFSKKENHDVSTALALIASLGTGALFLKLSDRYASGAYALLFGQIVGIGVTQVIYTLIIGIVSLAVTFFLFRPLLLTAVSKEIAAAKGISVRKMEIIFMLLVGLTASVIVPIVGALLSFSLIVEPAASSIYLAKDPQKGLIISVVLALVIVYLSLFLAYITYWPVGFFISFIGVLFYFASRIIHSLKS